MLICNKFFPKCVSGMIGSRFLSTSVQDETVRVFQKRLSVIRDLKDMQEKRLRAIPIPSNAKFWEIYEAMQYDGCISGIRTGVVSRVVVEVLFSSGAAAVKVFPLGILTGIIVDSVLFDRQVPRQNRVYNEGKRDCQSARNEERSLLTKAEDYVIEFSNPAPTSFD